MCTAYAYLDYAPTINAYLDALEDVKGKDLATAMFNDQLVLLST
jgi:hypothetical protein